jgi:hypothetical protein
MNKEFIILLPRVVPSDLAAPEDACLHRSSLAAGDFTQSSTLLNHGTYYDQYVRSVQEIQQKKGLSGDCEVRMSSDG